MPDLNDISGNTILIVDDDPINIKIVQAIIEKSGYLAASALDGKECINEAKKSKPDLIILDINMPGLSGIETCSILQKDEQTAKIPIIFLTADTDDRVLSDAFLAGGTDYIRKPANRMELLARIKSVLNQSILQEKLMAEEKTKAILEMAGTICHELNQPLQVIAGYAELLMMKTANDDSCSKMINKIQAQVDRMSEITMKLMQITRYETQEYVGDTKIIDIDKAAVSDKIRTVVSDG